MYSDINSRGTFLAIGVAMIFTISSFVLYSTSVGTADTKVTLAGDQEVSPFMSASTEFIVIDHTTENTESEIPEQLKP